jgi:hypothetical protein
MDAVAVTRAEFDAACEAARKHGTAEHQALQVRWSGGNNLKFWLSGKRISRAQAEALIEEGK